ncbi:MAG TPA: wax ester/triacylglycerol synthase domain-containing protein [Acidimicrobiales bacterium]|nr:wax ester/triacylglycerol synthase domain-containing protein [Acidimicrobiales bacterium]
MAAELQFDDRMNNADAVMWVIEKDPLLRSTITGVAVLDRPPDREAFTEVWERASRLVPRLRQRVVSHPFSVAPPRWEIDPGFDLGYHVRYVRSPGSGTMRDVLNIAQPLAMQGFDRARPLWEVVAVDGLADGRCAVLLKLHHSMTDGVGFVNMAMAFFDLERDGWKERGPMPDEPTGSIPSLPRRFVGGLSHEIREMEVTGRRAAGALLSTMVATGRDPVEAWRQVSGTLASIARTMAPTPEPLSPVMRGRSLSRHFDVLDVGLDDLKAAAKAVEGHINDAFVAATVGGLSRYHQRQGAGVDALRMQMPVNIRHGDSEVAGGNQFAPVRFVVPLDIADPRRRMRAVHELVSQVRAEPALGLSAPIAGVLYRLGTSISTAAFQSMMRGVDFVTSNVPGVAVPVYFAGSRVDSVYAFGPNAGAAVNLSLFSCMDQANIGANMDPGGVTDPDGFMDCLRDGFDEVCAVGR